MEAPAHYGPTPVRPRLTVVNDGPSTYSALPHDLLRDPRTQHGHIVAYAVLQMHWWQGGECWASHATLANEAKCSDRQLQRYLKDLVAWGYISERRRGQGQAKAYAAAKPDTGDQFNRTPVSDCEPNTTPVSEQHDTGVAFNTTPVSYRRRNIEKESSGRKKKDSAPTEPAARESTKSGRLLDLLKASDIHVTMRGQDHKALKESGADPALVAEAYGALFRGEWGDDFMRRSLSVQFVIGRLAGYVSWKREQLGDMPHTNGTAPSLTPATDADRAIWGRAMEDLRGLVSAGNFETYLAPLEIAGRLDGGLCLIVPPNVGQIIANYRTAISRALMDAGDPAPLAVAFKARRSTGAPTHAG